jgi:exosortase/archaeosortase family protein
MKSIVRRKNDQRDQRLPPAQALAPVRLGARFTLVAASVAAVLLGIYFHPYPEGGGAERVLRAYLAGYAKLAGAFLSVFEPGIVVDATTIRGPLFSMQFVRTCDAMEITILLGAALVAYPMAWRRRLAALVGAAVVMVALNLGRLCLLFALGVHAPAWFEPIHRILAPLVLVAGALGLFVIATRPRARRPTPVGATP